MHTHVCKHTHPLHTSMHTHYVRYTTYTVHAGFYNTRIFADSVTNKLWHSFNWLWIGFGISCIWINSISIAQPNTSIHTLKLDHTIWQYRIYRTIWQYCLRRDRTNSGVHHPKFHLLNHLNDILCHINILAHPRLNIQTRKWWISIINKNAPSFAFNSWFV